MNKQIDALLERIESCELFYNTVKDRTTIAYLNLLNTMRADYETLHDEEKGLKICNEIVGLITKGTIVPDNADKMLLETYDTMARFGDFRAYCIALEWNRPIEKQFFLPRKILLEKHGVIQAFQDLQDDKLDFLCLNLPPRIGKLLSNDTPILTKGGWKTHGDLKVGDYVLNDKGRFVQVQAVSPEQPCTHVVTFANGEKITCHSAHEWKVFDKYAHKYKIVETEDMIGKLYSKSNGYRFQVSPREPIMGEHKELPVAPYTLGAWLGDGTHCNPCITSDKKDILIAQTIEKEGYPIRNIYVDKNTGTLRIAFNNLRRDLQRIDLCYSNKQNVKYIPDIYFTASLQQRLELLAGLIDTDGVFDKSWNQYKFSTSNETLKDDFIKLISTFGWRCSVSTRKPEYKSINGVIPNSVKVNYVIGFYPSFEIPCRLERKKSNSFSKPRRLGITNIEPISEPKKGHCIQVEGGIYLAGKTLIPTHNSTLSLFFLTFRAGLYPDQAILGSGHSTALTNEFYKEMLNIITGEEYRYGSIFPNHKIVYQSAEYTHFDFNHQKRFHTVSFRSIDSGTTGLVEASNLLYCDDLVKDVETANNNDRLEKLFYNYTSSLQDRKTTRLCKDGIYRPCPELHVNTPWSINDVTNRLIRIYNELGDNPRVRVISVPCYDENGESNFMYDYGKGFDKEYYHQLQRAEDPVIFSAKYLMECIERDGRPFTSDQLTYFSELPEETPDRIVCYSDVAHGGEDYYAMPIGYVYGSDVYIADVLFVNKMDDSQTRPLVCRKIIEHKIQRAGFEENNGGKLYADLVARDLRRTGYHCNITTHKVPTTKSKLDRILSCQSEIKGIASEQGEYRIFFKSYESRKDNKQYCDFMNNIYNWSQKQGSIQKRQHDDALDATSGLILNILSGNNVGRASSKIKLSKYGL